MALITFVDATGVEWRVREVTRARIATPRSETPGSRASRAVLPGLESVWLSFECWREERRLTPYPAAWRDLAPGELQRLCDAAVVVAEPLAARPAERPSPVVVALDSAIRASMREGLTDDDTRRALQELCGAMQHPPR
jgi:hypothetical protein